MSRLITVGMLGAHVACLISNERLSARVKLLEARLKIAEQRIAGVSSCCCAAKVDEPSVAVEAIALGSRPWWIRWAQYWRAEISRAFNIVLALFLVLCVAAFLNLASSSDLERALDYYAYILPVIAALVAGARLLSKSSIESSGSDPNAAYFKFSALMLICGACFYFALKGFAPSAFYVSAGFAGFVFASFLVLDLRWQDRRSWSSFQVVKAVFYACLWCGSVMVAVAWAFLVSSGNLDAIAMLSSP